MGNIIISRDLFPVFLGVFLVVEFAEIVLVSTWNRTYFVLGRTIFIPRLPLNAFRLRRWIQADWHLSFPLPSPGNTRKIIVG